MKKILSIALILLIFFSIGTVTAQSNMTGANLVQRAENLAAKFETMERRTKTEPSTDSAKRQMERDIYQIEDESSKFSNDISYAARMEVEITEAQWNRIFDAIRRIENSGGQIQRNVQRW